MTATSKPKEYQRSVMYWRKLTYSKLVNIKKEPQAYLVLLHSNNNEPKKLWNFSSKFFSDIYTIIKLNKVCTKYQSIAKRYMTLPAYDVFLCMFKFIPSTSRSSLLQCLLEGFLKDLMT